MRKTIIAVAGIIAAVAMAGTAHASHIAIAGLTGASAGPGTRVVNFVHVEKETTLCCAGSPALDFGDGTIGFLDEVSINQDTEPGTYTGSLYDADTYDYLGPIQYTVSHVGEPPLPEGTAYNTMIRFQHTYPAAGAYTVRWEDCCFGTPNVAAYVPYEVSEVFGDLWWDVILPAMYDAQAPLDAAWEIAVQPTVSESQEHSPFGISAGTTRVVAL